MPLEIRGGKREREGEKRKKKKSEVEVEPILFFSCCRHDAGITEQGFIQEDTR